MSPILFFIFQISGSENRHTHVNYKKLRCGKFCNCEKSWKNNGEKINFPKIKVIANFKHIKFFFLLDVRSATEKLFLHNLEREKLRNKMRENFKWKRFHTRKIDDGGKKNVRYWDVVSVQLWKFSFISCSTITCRVFFFSVLPAQHKSFNKIQSGNCEVCQTNTSTSCGEINLNAKSI